MLAGDFEGQGTLAVHRIAGVEGDVDQCGFELAGVDACIAGLIGQFNLHMNACTGNALEHLADILHALADIEHLRVQWLAPGKGEQLAGELAGPLDGVGHRAHVALAALFG